MNKNETIINLELTSKCNRRCFICPHGNPKIKINPEFISLDNIHNVLSDIFESLTPGLRVREIINSGYGESLLHPNLIEIFNLYENFKIKYNSISEKPIIISLVTNGSLATYDRIKMISNSLDILKFSFPTTNNKKYGKIMFGSEEKGPELLKTALHNLKSCMKLNRQKILNELRIHISPPCTEAYADFPNTINDLTCLASSVSLEKINLVIFPTTSNRAGSVECNSFTNTHHKNFIRQYGNKKINGVLINFLSELNVFYSSYFEVLKVLENKFPCIWKNGSISINVKGNYRFCINDWATQIKTGNIESVKLIEIFNRLKNETPKEICFKCNQNPYLINTGITGKLYSFFARKIKKENPSCLPKTILTP